MELPFWGGSRDNKKYERLSSGYGPYALTRLCAETGGVYFVADQSSIRFDPAIMREYHPDYRPIRDYIKDLQNNLAKLALVRACEKTRADGCSLRNKARVPTPTVLACRTSPEIPAL